MTPTTGDRGPRLKTRILGAMSLVVLAGAGTLIVVSVLVAPAVFYRHLDEAVVARDELLARHVDDGFATAIVVSTLVGVLIAVAVAAAMATLVSRRISRPVTVAADIATRLANGDYSARMPSPRMGPELDDLADAVNALAVRLEATERTRMRLMSDLAHELRTPLASIDATVEAIADHVLPADAETLATLTDNAHRLSRLVEDLAAVSRAEERSFRLDVVLADLVSLARTAIANVAARFAAEGVDLQGPVGSGPEVDVDPDRIVEVVGQLLDNALNACRGGGSVAVAVGVRGATAALTVADSGVGFDPLDAEAIFQRFYRGEAAPQRAPGTGIGLTIARSLVEAQGGTLAASTGGRGKGATLTLCLPLAS